MSDVGKGKETISRAGLYWLVAFFTVALLVGLWHAFLLLDHGEPYLTSILVGSVAGVFWSIFVVMLPTMICWRIWMRITRGAPFRVGDRVVITDGPLKGEVAVVRKLCEGRCAVWVALEHESNDSSDLYYFEWDQICRADRRVGLPSEPQ
ncbi:MAG: hypothetical protein QXS54_12630 [Candidatus Methanomethylicaceae archaeon]